MKYGIYIGARKGAVREYRHAIGEILSSGCEQKTLRAALETLRVGCAVNHTSLNNCYIGGDNKECMESEE